MSKKTKIQWSEQPEAHDYPAAAAYLAPLLEARVEVIRARADALPLVQALG